MGKEIITNSQQFDSEVAIQGNLEVFGTTTLRSTTIIGSMSSTNLVYDSNGNSALWNNAYTTVQSNSAEWESVYTTVQSNSASQIKTNASDATPVYTIRAITQVEYDAILVKDLNTLYFIA
jgi:hypothetical protein